MPWRPCSGPSSTTPARAATGGPRAAPSGWASCCSTGRIGRKLRPKLTGVGTPLARVKPKHLKAAGVERTPRTAGVRDGLPLLEDGRALEVANVVWCTGFRPGFPWIDLPVFEDDGEPRHDRGVVASAPGLYVVGRFFQTAVASSLLGWVGNVAGQIAARAPAANPPVTVQGR